MKTETGVMVMKDGRAWGVTYKDGHSTQYGWMDPESAPIRNPKYCTEPTSATWDGSPYVEELKTGKVVHVRRTTVVEILENDNCPDAGATEAKDNE